MNPFQSGQREKPEGFADPKLAYAAVEFICGQFAKTVIVFLRHDFGERYFNVIDSFGSTLTFIGFAVVAGVVLASENDGLVLGLFLFGFIGMSLFHLFLAKQRDRSGRRWHSRYPGTSYLAFIAPGNVFFVQRYLEPILAIILGFALAVINRPLGVWFVFSGFCIAATEQIAAQRFRNRLLDAIDAQIEAEQLGEAIAGNKNPYETEGFVFPIPNYYTDEQRTALYKGMTKLDPSLQAMIDETTTATSDKEAEPQLS